MMLIEKHNPLTGKSEKMSVNITPDQWARVQKEPKYLLELTWLTNEEKLFLSLGISVQGLRATGVDVRVLEVNPAGTASREGITPQEDDAAEGSMWPVCPDCGERHPPEDVGEMREVFGDEVVSKFAAIVKPGAGRLGLAQVRDMRTGEVVPMLVYQSDKGDDMVGVSPLARILTNAELDLMDARLVDQDDPDADGERLIDPSGGKTRH